MPIPMFEGRSPLELIARGDHERVARVVSSIQYSAFHLTGDYRPEPVAVTGIWVRHLPAGGDSLWSPPELPARRWQRGR